MHPNIPAPQHTRALTHPRPRRPAKLLRLHRSPPVPPPPGTSSVLGGSAPGPHCAVRPLQVLPHWPSTSKRNHLQTTNPGRAAGGVPQGLVSGLSQGSQPGVTLLPREIWGQLGAPIWGAGGGQGVVECPVTLRTAPGQWTSQVSPVRKAALPLQPPRTPSLFVPQWSPTSSLSTGDSRHSLSRVSAHGTVSTPTSPPAGSM